MAGVEWISAHEYWVNIIKRLVVRNDDLRLIGDYLIVGLGGGFRTLHKYLKSPADVTGEAYVVKSHTGTYKDLRISTIAIAGGGIYIEWVVGIAAIKGVKGIIGIG